MASNGLLQSETTKGQGAATILAIGTANPPTCYDQATFPDFIFRVTEREDEVKLKEKFQRICDKSGIDKRYVHITEEMLKAHPNLYKTGAPSYNIRQQLLLSDVAELGKEAALKAIKEWDQPISKITHLVCSTATGIEMPGLDYQLSKLLNLNNDVQRYMYYQQGCYSGAAAIRAAKDLAENNPGARVLVVNSELLSTMFFHGPDANELDHLVGDAIFGDGATSVIIGTHPDLAIERPLFQLESAKQVLIPGSEGILGGNLHERGATYYITPKVPIMVGDNIEANLKKAFSHIGISDWNSLFYIVHPGGPAILNKVRDALNLKEDKLRASFQVLKDYGNMGGPSVIFAMDEMRKKALKEGKSTTGDGLQWGVLIGLGPGVTMETIVLRSCPIQQHN
ncbi:stilbene synthase 4-like [Rutidosis leptorrhynchoides]|uniref:stilbene synthase 4-like n=1 Tax=Rutidosis leptorrhynchoides TaxID=125765 RepID=UPI003A98D233